MYISAMRRALYIPALILLIVTASTLGYSWIYNSAVKGEYRESIELSGIAWDLSDDRPISVLLIPDRNVVGWRESFVIDVKDAFTKWRNSILSFTSSYGYKYLQKISFTIYVDGVNTSASDRYDIVVKWVHQIADGRKIGETRTLSQIDCQITDVSIILATAGKIDGKLHYLDDRDMRNVAGEEIGHALGLGHTNTSDDLIYSEYVFPDEEFSQTTLDLYALAAVYSYLNNGVFSPPEARPISLDDTGIPYISLN